MLCISISKWMLRMPFASQNQIFEVKTTFNVLFSHKMYNMKQKITKTHIKKEVYQRLGVDLKAMHAVKNDAQVYYSGRPLFYYMFLPVFVQLCFLFSLFSFVSEGKICFSVKKLISTSKRHVEHPLTGRNTQHMEFK